MLDNQLIEAYVRELEALRAQGRIFAQMYPNVAARLDIGSSRSRDPGVERVVESTAFLAARMRLMIENNATELPQAILSILAPALLEPIPSMALLDLQDGSEAQNIPRGTRFDYHAGGRSLVCFSTTMEVTASPLALKLRRLAPSRGAMDGIGVRLVGHPAAGRLLLCLGNDELSAATLMDAFAERLVRVELAAAGDGAPVQVPRTSVRIHGFTPEEAALPVRPAAHNAHRLVTEFIAFPAKFRFISLSGIRPAPGAELRFWFSQPLALPAALAPDLISVNRVPAVNLWPAAATPFNVDGRNLEYPVRIDALRYRTVECHSVEKVDFHTSQSNESIRLDPVVAFGSVRGTSIRWGVRRTTSRMGAEVLLYFQGLDYATLGRQRFLAAPTALASNRDVAYRIPVGSRLEPIESLGGWRSSLAIAPTPYRPAMTGPRTMESLIGYLNSSMSSLISRGRRNVLRDFLRQFPGGREASWVDGIGPPSLRQVAALHGGHPHAGLAMMLPFDSDRYRTTSWAMIKRVIGELLDSQRGLNQVEEVIVRPV